MAWAGQTWQADPSPTTGLLEGEALPTPPSGQRSQETREEGREVKPHLALTQMRATAICHAQSQRLPRK